MKQDAKQNLHNEEEKMFGHKAMKDWLNLTLWANVNGWYEIITVQLISMEKIDLRYWKFELQAQLRNESSQGTTVLIYSC